MIRFLYTEHFKRSYRNAPKTIREAFDRKVYLLATNLRHPSLRAKKYDETRDIWQARITHDWRFYFKIDGDTYIMLDVISHPK